MSNPNHSKSGHEYITISKAGNFKVVVAGVNLGTFYTMEKALEIRDGYMKKNNMRKART